MLMVSRYEMEGLFNKTDISNLLSKLRRFVPLYEVTMRAPIGQIRTVIKFDLHLALEVIEERFKVCDHHISRDGLQRTLFKLVKLKGYIHENLRTRIQ